MLQYNQGGHGKGQRCRRERKPCNGWTFRKYERAQDDWVKIDVLRKK